MRLAHHAIALFLLLSSAVAARANPYIWSGNGADNKWSTPANWQTNVAPNVADGSPDTLVFLAGAAQTSMHNDLPAGSAIAVLQFHGHWEVTGNQIRVTDRIEQFDTGTGLTRLYCPIVLANASGLTGTVTFKVQHLLALNGVVSGAVFTGLRKEGVGTLVLANANTYGGHTTVAEGILQLTTSEQGLGLTTAGTTILDGARLRLLTTPNFDTDEPITIAGDGASLYPSALVADSPGTVLRALSIGDTDASILLTPDGDLRVTNPVTGAAGLVKWGPGTLTFAGVGSNTYTGVTINRGGLLQLSKAVAIPAGLIVEEGTVRLHAMNAIVGGVRIDAAGTLDLNGHSDAVSALEGTGTVTLGAASLLVVPTASGEHSTFGGSITGTGKITKGGPARLTLSGTSTNAGGLTIADGIVRVTGSITGPVTVSNIGPNTGTLLGEGTIGELIGEAGMIYVGPGPLRTQSVTLNSSVQLWLGIINAMPSTGEPLLAVTGSVTLNDTPFAILTPADFLPSGRRLVLIDNDGSDPVNGTFQGAPEGGIVTFGGDPFRITYAGGTGNDVVATAIATEHHLSEGATGQFFDTDLLIANPNGTHAPIEVRYLKPGGAIVTQSLTVPALSRSTIRVDEVATLESTEVSFIVRSLDNLPIVVERTMRWGANGYGAHTEKAVDGPSKTWYFAEGAQGFFSTYLLLANPHAVANTATVEYLRENAVPLVREYSLEPYARVTVDTNGDPELLNQSFGMTVTFTYSGVAERSMYFGQVPLWNAGHESAGVPTPSTSWFLAEGATGPFFETFILLANPQDAPAEATLTFLPATGVPVTKTKTIPARSRLTVNIEAEDTSLANAAVATTIVSTQPIVVERAQYWPDPAPQWYEAHNSFGVTEAGTSWGLAEGRVGGPDASQTYILIANPSATDTAVVTLTFLREGKTPFSKTFTVNPTSRFNVSTGPGSLVPELQDERFGVAIASNLPIAVERAIYANAGGQLWGAGTNATATRLP